MKKSKKSLGTIGALILLALISYFLNQGWYNYEEGENDSEDIMVENEVDITNEVDETIAYGFEAAILEHVVDGDTIIVNKDGESYKVRLIGINCPESVHADESRNTEEGVEASKFTASVCDEGMTVYLQQDVSDVDQYGRLLRYVWLAYPEDPFDADTIEKYMLNAIIIVNGHSAARDYEPDVMYSEYLSVLD